MKIAKVFIILILFTTLCGCFKKEETEFLNGNMTGLVELYILPSYAHPDNFSGVKVSIENTSYMVFTNEIGRYDFKDIPAGTYNIIFEQEGYNTEKITGLQFMGGNVTVFLGKKILFKDTQ